jgi:glycosyltransferase involved in cell wall biosynthesis
LTKIVWHSNAPWVGTGYGSQTALFTPRIRELGHDVAISAFYGLQGRVLDWEGIKVYPSDGDWGNRWLAAFAADHSGCGDVQQTTVIGLHDVWVLKDPIINALRLVSWVPVDHFPLPPAVHDFFTRTGSIPVAMSRYGEETLRVAGLDPLYVPHGVDTAVLEPISEDEKQRIRALAGIPENAFVVGMVAANQGVAPSRKAFPQVFEAFAEFRQNHPEAMLYLHTIKTPGAAGLNLLALANQCGIPTDAIRWSAEIGFVMGLPYDAMKSVYGLMDVLANPAYGEGFGIPIVEAQACGLPVIVNDFSAMPELCGAGWKVRGDSWYDASQGSWFSAPRVGEIVQAMETAYIHARDPELKAIAREFALGYDADLVTHRYWVPVLAEIEARLDARTVLPQAALTPMNREQRRAAARAS